MRHRAIEESDKVCIAIALATALLLAIGMYFFPLISDDLKSVVYMKETFLGNKGFDFEGYADTLNYIFFWNHFRLPNLLMPIVILLPRWIPALLSCMSIYYIMRAGSRIGQFAGSWKSTTLLASGFILLFPWVDQLYLISFQAPYLWGCAIALFLLTCVLHPHKHSIILMAFTGFLTGFWQEAYASALLGTCVCLMIFYKAYRRKETVAIICSLICGILVNIMPLMARGIVGLAQYFGDRMGMIYPYILITLAYAALSLLMLRKHRAIVVSVTNIALLSVSVISALITLYLKTGSRIDGLGIICACIGSIYLLRQIPARSGKTARVAVTFVGIFSLWNIITVDALCYKLGKETDYVVQQYKHPGDRTIFAPLTLRVDAPIMSLQKPYFDWFAHFSTSEVFNMIYGNDSVRIGVVPARLKDFSPGKARKIPGSAGVYYYKRLLVGTDKETKRYTTYFGGEGRMHFFHKVIFRSTDGNEYVWLHPDYTSMEFLLHPVPEKMDTISPSP